jgi:hypothetical protein
MIISILAIVVGLLMCFFGYRLFRIWLAIAGLVLGAYLGYYLGGLVGSEVWPIAGAIVFAVLVSILAYALFKLGAVLIGASLGAMLLLAVLKTFGMEPVWWAALVGAAAGAILAGVFLKTFIIIGSAYSGSHLAVVGVYTLILNQNFMNLDQQELLSFPWYVLAAILVLTVVAAAVQMQYMRSNPSHPLNQNTSESA